MAQTTDTYFSHTSGGWGFPGGTDGIKNLPASAGEAGDVSPVPGSGRSPGGGHGNPLQSSHLENPMDRGAWQATVHRVAELDMTEATLHAHMHVLTKLQGYIVQHGE